MKTTAVIMAGGKGERFWPKSRNDLPKQFLSLTNDGVTMIQHTIDRLLPLVSCEDIFIVTNENYVSLVCQQLPNIPKENILAEPSARNTAPCIGLAAAVINKKYDDAIMIVLPSDHLIKYNDIYIDTLKTAIEAAQIDDNLITIGITPTYPETGYGYIHFEKTETMNSTYEVKRFVEKPSIDKAKEYLISGEYLWNSGMFVWKLSSIMKNFKKLMPSTYEGLMVIQKSIGTENFNRTLQKCFNDFASESIDYGIMEKAEHIYTIPGNFGWDDVGSWLALGRINKTDENDNIISGTVITVDSCNSIIYGGKKLIATVGIDNIIVVDTDDALLICEKSHAQDIKKVISQLKDKNMTEFL
jgi:mannose-1-phosphate guanylyltransferase